VTVRLAVVDDSSFVRKAIERVFSADSRIQVVGSASSGEELLTQLDNWRPDVITLDLSMPGMGGLLTLDRIMAVRPTPVLILSTHAGEGAPQTIEALHRGAADFIDKQRYSLLDFDSLREVLAQKVLAVTTNEKALSEPPPQHKPVPREAPDTDADKGRHFEVLLLGASTGGPPAIEFVLSALGSDCPLPVLIVQHMPGGFTTAFAQRLNTHLGLEVREAEHRAPLRPGTVVIAPAGKHLKIRRGPDGLVTILSSRPSTVAHRPSIDELFASAVTTTGASTLAVLMTGMGRDGAATLRDLRVAGAHTIAQDEATSVVWGMPGVAVDLNAAVEVLPLPRIASRLQQLLAEQAGYQSPSN